MENHFSKFRDNIIYTACFQKCDSQRFERENYNNKK